MRANLLAIHAGQKVPSLRIGRLTDPQLQQINAQRGKADMPPIDVEVLFVGAHIYRSRVLRDGYEIEDILDQAESALSESSAVLITQYMTAIQNPVPRADPYGNLVNDRAILECTRYRPNAELFSLVPKGDRIRPSKK